MIGIVDRFENDIAVVELDDGSFIDINKSQLPIGVCSGDVIEINDTDISINHEETTKRKDEIEALMDELFEE